MSKDVLGSIAVVPWYNNAELLKVYTRLYSEDVELKKWAVKRIFVWELRSQTLPFGIESTAAFVRSIIQDVDMVNKKSNLTESDMKLLYNSAVTRFFSALTKKRFSGGSSSIHKIFKKHGIPEWMSSVYRSALCGHMPTMDIFREVASFVLEWLQRNYWEKVIASSRDYVLSDNYVENEIRDTISHFQLEQRNIMRNVANHNEKMQKKKEIKGTLRHLKEMIRNHRKEFWQVFLQPGFFISTDLQLGSLLTDDESDFIESDSVELPVTLQKFWAPIVLILQKLNAVHEFVEELFKRQKLENELHQRIVTGWILLFIISDSTDNEFKETTTFTVSFHVYPNLCWTSLLSSCLINCCKYTVVILPWIIENFDPPLHNKMKSFIMGLVAQKIGAFSDCTEPGLNLCKDTDFCVLEKVQEILFLRDRKDLEKSDSGNCVWTKASDDIDWSKIPLGAFMSDGKICDVDSSSGDDIDWAQVPVDEDDKSKFCNDAQLNVYSNTDWAQVPVNEDIDESKFRSDADQNSYGNTDWAQVPVNEDIDESKFCSDTDQNSYGNTDWAQVPVNEDIDESKFRSDADQNSYDFDWTQVPVDEVQVDEDIDESKCHSDSDQNSYGDKDWFPKPAQSINIPLFDNRSSCSTDLDEENKENISESDIDKDFILLQENKIMLEETNFAEYEKCETIALTNDCASREVLVENFVFLPGEAGVQYKTHT